MELWGKEGAFSGAVCPAFLSRSVEPLPVPEECPGCGDANLGSGVLCWLPSFLICCSLTIARITGSASARRAVR